MLFKSKFYDHEIFFWKFEAALVHVACMSEKHKINSFEKNFQNWLRQVNNSYLSVCLFSMLDIHLRKGRIFIVGTSKLDIMNGWTPRNSQWVFTTSRFFCCRCLHPTFLMCNDLWCGGDNFWPLSLSLVVSLFRRPAF